MFQIINTIILCNELKTLTFFNCVIENVTEKVVFRRNVRELRRRSALVKEGVANGDEQEGETKTI